MTISAVRPVRSTDSLIDAPTIPGQRPAVEQFSPLNLAYRSRSTSLAVELGRRAWDLIRTSPAPLSDAQLAARLDATADEVNDAVSAFLATQPAPPSSDVLDLGRRVETLMNTTDLTADEIAARVGRPADEAFDALLDLICWQEGALNLVRGWERKPAPSVDWFGRPVTAVCSVAWCDGQCVCGGPAELGHSRKLFEDQVRDGCHIGQYRRLMAMIQQTESPELPGGFDDTTVYVTTGDTDAYGVDLDLDEAEAFALSILAGVRAARARTTGQSAPAGTAYRVDVFTADDVLMTSRTVTAADDRSAEVAARRLVDELGGAVMAAVFTASLVYVGTVTA
ncbi:hypothetical protein [Micromonospora inyonensis]|uniref:Uncharacterized protein n=1 Tax=Micromonospora inyonensis TaxID=47866 RepID=A0A1C6S7Q4_9ACTN|nr:hypothetical protein [Micromonospora inyonensis]SCL20439.1 hypothetical protein GA0074694_3037 [Micromonospora inyonensis]SCL25498.1 hypothetical protein GA0074694_4236 [Micromonospora inyonensis]